MIVNERKEIKTNSNRSRGDLWNYKYTAALDKGNIIAVLDIHQRPFRSN
jgi:hypothetical protein